MRQAVVGALAPGDVSEWHRDLAVSLEAAGAPAERLLQHWRAAGDLPRAQALAVDAAAGAMRELAVDRAARLLALALSLAAAAPERAAVLFARRAEALAAAGRGTEAAAAYAEARRRVSGDAATEYARLGAEQLLRSGRIDAGLDAFGSTRCARARAARRAPTSSSS